MFVLQQENFALNKYKGHMHLLSMLHKFDAEGVNLTYQTMFPFRPTRHLVSYKVMV